MVGEGGEGEGGAEEGGGNPSKDENKVLAAKRSKHPQEERHRLVLCQHGGRRAGSLAR